MDLLKAEAGACSPAARKRATEMYGALEGKVAKLQALKKQTKATKKAIQELESRKSQLLPFIAQGTASAGGSSSRVIAEGLEGEQGETVDVAQKTINVTMGDGRVFSIVKNTADKKGNPYSDAYLEQQAKVEAHNRAVFEAERGIQQIPGKGKAAPKKESTGKKIRKPLRAEREPGLHIAQRNRNAGTAKIELVGDNGEVLRRGTVPLADEEGKRHSNAKLKRLASEKLGDADEFDRIEEGVSGTTGLAEAEKKTIELARRAAREEGSSSAPREDLLQIGSFDDLPHHKELPIKPHAQSFSDYKKAVSTFYRNNRIEESVRKTADGKLSSLRSSYRQKFNKPGLTESQKKRLYAESRVKSATVKRKRDEILKEIKNRVSTNALREEHKALVSEAVRENKNGKPMYPEMASEVSESTLRDHDLPYRRMVTRGGKPVMEPKSGPIKRDKEGNVVLTPSKKPATEVVSPKKGSTQAALREAGAGEEFTDIFTAKTPSKDFDKHYSSVLEGAEAPPTKAFEALSKDRLYAKEARSAKTVNERTGENKRAELEKKYEKEGLEGAELAAAVKSGYDEWFNERFKNTRGETSPEDRGIAALKDWVKNTKKLIVDRREAALRSVGISPDRRPERVTEDQREILSRMADAEDRLKEQFAKKLSSLSSTTFGNLSERGQQEVLGFLRKSVNNMLNLTDGTLMPGLFLNTALFKALRLSEEQKIHAFENSFGRDSGGVGPATMNTGEIEAEEEKKDEQKAKDKMSKGLGLYVSC